MTRLSDNNWIELNYNAQGQLIGGGVSIHAFESCIESVGFIYHAQQILAR